MRPLPVLAAVLAAALVAAGSAFAVPSPRHTKQTAERNLLGATRVLLRWHTNLVNRRSGLLAQNTTARCTGVGRKRSAGYTKFRCVLRHNKIVVRVLYFSERHNHFEVRRLA